MSVSVNSRSSLPPVSEGPAPLVEKETPAQRAAAIRYLAGFVGSMGKGAASAIHRLELAAHGTPGAPQVRFTPWSGFGGILSAGDGKWVDMRTGGWKFSSPSPGNYRFSYSPPTFRETFTDTGTPQIYVERPRYTSYFDFTLKDGKLESLQLKNQPHLLTRAPDYEWSRQPKAPQGKIMAFIKTI
jgi:hypothetical protein